MSHTLVKLDATVSLFFAQIVDKVVTGITRAWHPWRTANRNLHRAKPGSRSQSVGPQDL